ncbi:MAG TPA: DNA-formamidopyrimidine glycosylase [Anaerolineaceae bacterium]|nr:DNA-formamidopyrimidine glycosylase [Anaerolineaceae bacterium]
MPELPEVETIRRILINGSEGIPSILGQVVNGASLYWQKTLATNNLQAIRQNLAGQEVLSLSRRGKYLLIEFKETQLVIHLRMSGDLRISDNLGAPRETDPILPHDRFYLHFGSGFGLAFNDTRKFGRVWWVADPNDLLIKLGMDPFDSELTEDLFFDMLQGKNRQIKSLLLDQSFLAGIGNIYSDEALFGSKINPTRSSRSLTHFEAGLLLEKIRESLQLGINHNGASIDWVYRGGDFQNYFQVYQRKGQPCPVCGTLIVRTTVSQRGTHYCPNCQPKEKKDT